MAVFNHSKPFLIVKSLELNQGERRTSNPALTNAHYAEKKSMFNILKITFLRSSFSFKVFISSNLLFSPPLRNEVILLYNHK